MDLQIREGNGDQMALHSHSLAALSAKVANEKAILTFIFDIELMLYSVLENA